MSCSIGYCNRFLTRCPESTLNTATCTVNTLSSDAIMMFRMAKTSRTKTWICQSAKRGSEGMEYRHMRHRAVVDGIGGCSQCTANGSNTKDFSETPSKHIYQYHPKVPKLTYLFFSARDLGFLIIWEFALVSKKSARDMLTPHCI